MKANDLMVGDIVLRKGKPVEIVSTSGIEYSFGQQDITIYQGKGNGLESHTMRGIAPMRMTEKLLMALGQFFCESGCNCCSGCTHNFLNRN